MIGGRIQPDGRAIVEIAVAGRTFDAVIDTGFDGGVSLPDSLALILNLPVLSHARYQLGDGSIVVVPIHEAAIELGGVDHSVEAVFSTADEVLLGTLLLKGYRLVIDYPAGTVSLDRPVP